VRVTPAYGENSGIEALSSTRCRCYPGLECMARLWAE
jgi:hypothetical protein